MQGEASTRLGFTDYFRMELAWARLLGAVLWLAPVPAPHIRNRPQQSGQAFFFAMLEHLAKEEATTVSAILTRELDDVASANADELIAAIPGFRAAFEWPGGVNAAQTC